MAAFAAKKMWVFQKIQATRQAQEFIKLIENCLKMIQAKNGNPKNSIS